jgi:hypothetical protein
MSSGDKTAGDHSPLPNELYEMELIGDPRFYVAVPVTADAELKKRILGAIKSYYSNLTSIDYTIKRYGQRWTFPDPSQDQRFVIQTLKDIDERVSEFLTAILNGRPRPDHAGLLAAEVALVRLKSTFRSALILISQAHAFEAAAIVRLALEQIAWAYAVHTLSDPGKILNVNPTQITPLKNLAPFAGRLYNALTAQAHLDPAKAKIYYTEEGEGTVEIRHQLSDESFVVLGYLLGVVGLFRQVILTVLGSYVDEPKKERLWRRSPLLPERLKAALKKLQADHPALAVIPNGLL